MFFFHRVKFLLPFSSKKYLHFLQKVCCTSDNRLQKYSPTFKKQIKWVIFFIFSHRKISQFLFITYLWKVSDWRALSQLLNLSPTNHHCTYMLHFSFSFHWHIIQFHWISLHSIQWNMQLSLKKLSIFNLLYLDRSKHIEVPSSYYRHCFREEKLLKHSWAINLK